MRESMCKTYCCSLVSRGMAGAGVMREILWKTIGLGRSGYCCSLVSRGRAGAGVLRETLRKT